MIDEPAVYQLTTNPASGSGITVNGAPVASGQDITLPGPSAAPAAPATAAETVSKSAA